MKKAKVPQQDKSVQPKTDTTERLKIVIPPNKDFVPYLIPNPENPKYPGVRLREGVIRLSEEEWRLYLSSL